MEQFRGTTILSVRRGNSVVIGGDGQVSMGNTIMKGNARKVRRLHRDQVLAGFAGGTADAFTLFELFEAQLDKHQGHLVRAAVELAKAWRTERALRQLEALLAVAEGAVPPRRDGDFRVQTQSEIRCTGDASLLDRQKPACGVVAGLGDPDQRSLREAGT